MKFQELLHQSKNQFALAGGSIHFTPAVFTAGARWMHQQLPPKKAFRTTVSYTLYGLGKYGLSLLAFVGSALLFYRVSPFLLPLSIGVFYLVEVHFLFLFPLLLDGVEQPLLKSVQQTYRIGLLTSVATVIPIGFYMLAGLCHFKQPLLNWHIGCGAILIWYQHEVRDWV